MSLLNKITNIFRENTRDGKIEMNAHGYTGKFVRQGNNDIGESIAVAEGRLIVKNPDGILSIPVEAVLTNAEHIAVGDFDREEAFRLGKEWFERKDTLKFDEKGMLIR